MGSEMCIRDRVKGLVHVTGGGRSNIDRVLPDGMRANFYEFKLPSKPEIYNIIQTEQGISDEEMNSVFNNGVGMYIIVAEKYKDTVMNAIVKLGVYPYHIGFVH